MRHEMTSTRQGGAALLAVVFLIAVLGSVAAYMVVTSSRSQLQPVQAKLAADAYQAARAGIEWGSYQAIVNGNADPNACNSGAFSPAGLTEFTVTVSCTSTVHYDGPVDVRVFVINATATAGTPGGLGFATRQMRAVVSPSAPL
ncbi:MAG: hypothetical protein R3270_04650 [Gammaproteobacteria bacterium]|nr:hypothetical protein [Gammaproteobacteria bacterium]